MASYEELDFAIQNNLFTGPKPIEKPDMKEVKIIEHLESKNKLMKMRKDDGHMNLVKKGVNNDISIYTSGLVLVNEKYPRIFADLTSMNLPERTLICSEVSRTVNGIQNRYAVRTSTERGLKFEASGAFLEMAFFNMLMWSGEDTSKWKNYDRYLCLLEHVRAQGPRTSVRMIQLLETSLEEARKEVELKKWEGLVIADMDAPTQFAIGTPGGNRPDEPRPYGAWKDKKGNEIDFVAYAFEKSTAASHFGAVKEFSIGLIDPVTRKLIPCGVCGTGITKKQRFEYAEAGALPIAVEVAFESWSEINQVPIQPRIKRIRDDKHFMQCLATENQLATMLSKERIDPTW